MSANVAGSGLPVVADRSRHGATARIEELFVSSEQGLGRYLLQMVGDRSLAEDLLQDTFHDAVRGWERLAAARSPEAWLFGIARNHALQALRRRRRFRRVLERLVPARREPRSNADEELVAVRDLLERRLAPEDRALVLLRYLHGFGAAELAEMTGRSPEAVRQRLSRARAALLEED